MRKKLSVLLVLLHCGLVLTGCSQHEEMSDLQENAQKEQEVTQETTQKQEDSQMQLKITVGGEEFTAVLEDNATAQAFTQQLPMTLTMDDLNSNEKYYYLDTSIRNDSASNPGTIHEGDIMCYGSDCLVLFYETFSTSYSYIPIGYIEDTTGYVEALGSGSAEVTFEMQ